MPYPFEAVTTRADDDRRLLTGIAAVAQTGQIIAQYIHGVHEVVEVLYFGNGAQATHGQTHTLPNNGGFADAGIGYAQVAKFELQAGKALVNIANGANVFAKGHEGFIAGKVGFKTGVQYFAAIYHTGLFIKLRCHNRYFERGIRAAGK